MPCSNSSIELSSGIAEHTSPRRPVAVAREGFEFADIAVTTESISAPLAILRDTAAVQARYFDLAMIGPEVDNPSARATAEAIIFG